MIRYLTPNRTLEFSGVRHRGWLVDDTPPPPAASRVVTLDLEIKETDFGFFLEWHDADDEISGHTWHVTIEDAMEQAQISFGVRQSEWLLAAG